MRAPGSGWMSFDVRRQESEMEISPERLGTNDRSGATAVFREAFATHPMLPPGTSAKTSERLMELMTDTFGRHKTAALHGIRQEGTLVCAAMTLANDSEPKGLALACFLTRLCFVLGWRLIRDFARAMSNQPKYDRPYLDLMLLGTLPTHHGRGLGRTMLRFIYAMAESQGYHGVTLAVAKDTPAHRLYLKEGFVTVAEVPLRSLFLCYMRRDKSPIGR
jgi:GNAT superfamily N-acetyltransferase